MLFLSLFSFTCKADVTTSPQPLPVYTKPNIFSQGSETTFFDTSDANKLYAPTKPLIETLPEFIISTIFLIFSGLGVVFAFIAGYKIIFSKGDQKKMQEGIQTLVYAVLGLIITGSAWMIIRLVLNISFGG